MLSRTTFILALVLTFLYITCASDDQYLYYARGNYNPNLYYDDNGNLIYARPDRTYQYRSYDQTQRPPFTISSLDVGVILTIVSLLFLIAGYIPGFILCLIALGFWFHCERGKNVSRPNSGLYDRPSIPNSENNHIGRPCSHYAGEQSSSYAGSHSDDYADYRPTPILSSSDAYSGFNQFIPDQREWGASYEHSWWNQDDVEHLSVSAMTTPRDFEAPQSSEEEALILEATLQASAHDADTMETSNIKAAEDASLADAIEEQEISKAVEQSLKEKRVVAPKDVVIPNNLPRIFKREVDEYDTDTIGYLLGNLNSDRRYVVTELYIPPRSEEWNSYEVRNADSLDYPKTNGLTVLGWIRRSVRKEYSWSYIDLHRQYEFQKTESSFLGIVVCQHHEKSNIFSLTEKGLKSCKDCRQPLDAVHRHSGDRHLYRHAGHYSFDGHLKTKVVDHRDKSMKLPYEVERMERDEDVDGSVSVKQRKHKSKAKSKVVDALLDAKAFEGLVLDVVKKIPGRKLFQHEKKKATRPSLQDMQKRLVVELAESPSLNTVETPIESGLLQTEKKKPSKKKTVSFTELDIRSPTVVKDEGPVADHPDVLNPLIIPENLIEDFSNYRRVKHNTAKNVETGAFLLGRLDSTGNFVVTSLYFPPQSGSANTFSVHDNDDSYFKYVIDNDLKELGWIHTHPTQDCFLSSIDLHTQYAFQKDRSWFIGIVVAPSINQNRIFSLTKSGFQILKACKESSDKFHQHREDDFLYELANHCVHGKSQNIVIIDRMSSE